MRTSCFTVILSVLFASSAFAWWDTKIMQTKESPKFAEIEAEKTVIGGGAAVIDDLEPWGPVAGSKKAVVLKPGQGSLTWTVNLPRSVYKLFAVARVPQADPVKNSSPEWPVFARMTVTGPDGKSVGDWTMPINYLNTYYDTARIYFPAHLDGRYVIVFSITDKSQNSLTVDRLELRDELGNTFKKGFKQGRYLHSDAEVAQMRKNVSSIPNPVLDPAGRSERVEAFRKAWGEGYEKWNTPERGNWELKGLPEKYLATGDPQIALAAAQMLIQAADWYPALDWSAQVAEGHGNLNKRNFRFTFTDGRFGKILYSGWEPGYPDAFAKIYDAIFPFIVANADELAEMARVRVPWIKNREDLIAFFDTNLLQYTGDCVNRNMIRCAEGGSEMIMLPVIAVQGANPAGEKLARWLFSLTYWDGTLDGGIQDQAITGRLRDGSNNIGSVSYTESSGAVLVAAAELMLRYIASGGSREFDMSDTGRFPAVLSGAFLPLECRIAGGYHARVGDWGRAMDPRVYKTIANYHDSIRFAFDRTGDPRMAWLLKNVFGRSNQTDAVWQKVEQAAAGQRDPQLSSVSRNLEGFGLAILESGTELDDFTKKRAIAFRHGAAKGHAHADALNIEFFANGVRAVPDAGNRGGAPHPGNMNAHLGVTVDNANMRNTSEINTGATAWTTAFKPSAGAQYVAGKARFAASAQVQRYERQLVLVDLAGQDASYVFDVLRVAGGKIHTWSTHGPARSKEEIPVFNFPLKPADSETAREVLAGHLAGQESTAPEVVSATWQMSKEFEEKMLESAFVKNLPPLFTRSLLFGHQGDRLFVGDSDPEAKGLEKSQWRCTVGFMHARRTGEKDIETVWPQLLESYRGQPLIKTAKALPVTPSDTTASAPVAVEIDSASGQRDVILFDGAPPREVKAGTVTMNGQFGFLSYDAKGLRLAHLVGGTVLADGKFRIEAGHAGYKTTIKAVDYVNNRFTLSESFPSGKLNGQELLIGSNHPQVWKTVKVDGDQVTLAMNAIAYQSQVLAVDEGAGEIVCQMNPNMLMADPHWYDGTTAFDESGGKQWKVKTIRPKFIFMYLQEPLQDWRETFSDADFPDADGDGKRTVTITNWGNGNGNPFREKLTLEVAYVDSARQVIYFKLPDDQEIVNANGWQWTGSRLMDSAKARWMVNEKGRKWLPNYIGKQHVVVLEGNVKDKDLTDNDHDGRRVLKLYHYGIGDPVAVPSHVHVSRQEDGTFKLDASTPVKVTLPDGRAL